MCKHHIQHTRLNADGHQDQNEKRLSWSICLVQAVPVAQTHSSQYYPQQAVFALNEASGRLYAAGGAAPSTVHTWDMSQECCTQQVRGFMDFTLLGLVICSYAQPQCMLQCSRANMRHDCHLCESIAKLASPGRPLLDQC